MYMLSVYTYGRAISLNLTMSNPGSLPCLLAMYMRYMLVGESTIQSNLHTALTVKAPAFIALANSPRYPRNPPDVMS